MASLSNSFEGGTSGTGITTGNSGSTSGDAFSTVTLGSGATATYDNTHARGTLAANITTTTSNTGYLSWTTLSNTTVYAKCDLYITANPASSTNLIQLFAGATLVGTVRLLTTGQLQAFYNTGSISGAKTFLAVPLNQWCTVEVKMVSDSAAGSIQIRLYTDATSAVISDWTLNSGVATNASSSAITAARFGVLTSIASTTFWFDNLTFTDSSWPSGIPDGNSSYEGTRTPGSTQGTGSGIQVGTVFQASQTGKVSGLRYYRNGTLNDGSNVVVTLFDKGSGTKLAQATHAQVLGDGTGWVMTQFTTPQAITANTDYIACAYYSTNRAAKSTTNAFPLTASPLTASGSLINTSATDGNTAPATTDTNDWFVDVMYTPDAVVPSAALTQSVTLSATGGVTELGTAALTQSVTLTAAGGVTAVASAALTQSVTLTTTAFLTVVKWSGEGLSAGTFTTSSVGTGDTPVGSVQGTAPTVDTSGSRPPRIKYPANVTSYVVWGHTAVTSGAWRWYFETPDAAQQRLVVAWTGSAAAWVLDLDLTGRLVLLNNAGSVLATASATMPVNTNMRIEVTYAAGQTDVYLYDASSTLTEHLSASQTGLTVTELWLGCTFAITHGPPFVDDLAVTDRAVQIGPVSDVVVSASAALTQSVTLSAAATPTYFAAAALTQSVTLSAAGVLTQVAAAALTQAVTLTAALSAVRVTFVGGTSTALTASGTTINVLVPPGTLGGHLRIIAVELGTDSISAYVPPSGWTEFSFSPLIESGRQTLHVYWRIAGGTLGQATTDASQTISWTGSTKAVCASGAWTGHDRYTTINTVAGQIVTTNSTTAATPTVTPTTGNTEGIAIWACRSSTAARPWTADAATTSRVAVDNGAATSAPYVSLMLADTNSGAPQSAQSYTSSIGAAESHKAGILLTVNADTGPYQFGYAPLVQSVTLGAATVSATTAAAALTQQVTMAVTTPGVFAASAALTQSVTLGVTARAGRQINVSTIAQLQTAIDNAIPGDIIVMADGSYTGATRTYNYGAGVQGAVGAPGAYAHTFTGNIVIGDKHGTADAPITLVGGPGAVIDGNGPGGHYGVYVVNSSYWILSGFTVGGTIGANKGVVSDGSPHCVYDSLEISNIGAEGLHLRSFSADCEVRYCYVHDTGKSQQQFGEGIYNGSANSNWSVNSFGFPDTCDRTWIHHNHVERTGAESIDCKEGSSHVIVEYNHFDGSGMSGQNSADSCIDAKGNNWIFRYNTVTLTGGFTAFVDGFQVHQNTVAGQVWGLNNIFYGNTFDFTTGGFGPITGYAINVVSGSAIVGADNTQVGATSGLTNIATSSPVIAMFQDVTLSVAAFSDPGFSTAALTQAVVLGAVTQETQTGAAALTQDVQINVSAGVEGFVEAALTQAVTLTAAGIVQKIATAALSQTVTLTAAAVAAMFLATRPATVTAYGMRASVQVRHFGAVTLWPDSTIPPTSTREIGGITAGNWQYADVDLWISALQYYRGQATDTGPHIGTVYGLDRSVLAQVTYTDETTGTGWRNQTLPSLLHIAAGTPFCVCVTSANGYYSATPGGLVNGQITSADGNLHAYTDSGSPGSGNGVFSDGSTPSFPDTGGSGVAYAADILASTDAPADTHATTPGTVQAFGLRITANTVVPSVHATTPATVGAYGMRATVALTAPGTHPTVPATVQAYGTRVTMIARLPGIHSVTTVTHQVIDPSRTTVAGVLVYAELVGGQYADTAEVVAQEKAVSDNGGNVTLQLIPNAQISPANSKYKIVVGDRSQRFVTVPDSTDPIPLTDLT